MTTPEQHKYFTTSRTNAHPHKEGGKIAVHFSEAPRRNKETGATSLSFIWPGLLITDCVEDPETFAQEVTQVLNENAHRFFESAPKPQEKKPDMKKPPMEIVRQQSVTNA